MRLKPTNTAAYLLCSALLVGLAGPGVAQECESESDAAEEQQQAEQREEAKEKRDASSHAPRARRQNQRDDDVFRPSEEISEDFAVSFPVDI